MSQKKNLNRRHFIKTLSTGGAAYGLYSSILTTKAFADITQALFQKLMTTAVAGETTGGYGKNYLLFLHPGAPPRWTCDQFLSTTKKIENGIENEEYIPHPVVKNVVKQNGVYLSKYTANNADNTYESTDQPFSGITRTGENTSVYLPKLWDIPLPVWNGTNPVFQTDSPFRMSHMLPNTMIIRGYQLQADFGHFRGPSLQSQPKASEPSISGLVADRAADGAQGKKMPAIALTDSPSRPLGYRSESAKITLGTSGGSSNKASDLLSPFMRENLGADHLKNKATMKLAVETALTQFQETAAHYGVNQKSLFKDNAAVQDLVDLLKQENLATKYSQYKAKYAALVRYCCVEEPGLLGQLKIVVNNGIITGSSYMSDPYSDKFALAELFIEYGLTASFTFLCGGSAVPGSYIDRPNNAYGAQNDEHDLVDRQISFFGHHWKYRAWMACVNEFSKAIGPGQWADTVVQFGSEYARSPNKGSGGSDHAINACVTTVLSGSITSFLPIGNIYKTAITDPAHGNYGTYGVGAPTDIEGVGTMLIPNEYVANTVLSLLEIESPLRDKSTLIKKLNGQWVPKTETPKNKVKG